MATGPTTKCKFHPRRDAYARGLCLSCYQHEWRIKNKFGLSPEERKALLKESWCYVCHTKKNLHLDLDRETKRIRGVLCKAHQNALGTLRSQAETNRIVSYMAPWVPAERS